MTPDFEDLMAKAKAAKEATQKGYVNYQLKLRGFEAAAAPDTIIALLEERKRLREALEEIATAHLGDCPAAMEEVDHAHIHIINLRKIARAVVRDET